MHVISSFIHLACHCILDCLKVSTFVSELMKMNAYATNLVSCVTWKYHFWIKFKSVLQK